MFVLTNVPAGATGIPESPNRKPLESRARAHLGKADRAFDEENRAEAVFHYHSARSLYGKLQEQFPDWEADYVAYRLDYCDTRLRSIQEETEGDPWYWWARQRNEWQHQRAALEARNTALREENRYLREQLRAAENALEKWNGETAEVETLRDELQRLREENRLMRRALERRETHDAPVPRR